MAAFVGLLGFQLPDRPVVGPWSLPTRRAWRAEGLPENCPESNASFHHSSFGSHFDQHQELFAPTVEGKIHHLRRGNDSGPPGRLTRLQRSALGDHPPGCGPMPRPADCVTADHPSHLAIAAVLRATSSARSRRHGLEVPMPRASGGSTRGYQRISRCRRRSRSTGRLDMQAPGLNMYSSQPCSEIARSCCESGGQSMGLRRNTRPKLSCSARWVSVYPCRA